MDSKNLDVIRSQKRIEKLRNQLEAELEIINGYLDDYQVTEVSDLYHKSKAAKHEYLDLSMLKFPFKKFMIESKSGRLNSRSLISDKFLSILKEIIKSVFQSNDYVLVISDNHSFHNETQIRMFFEALKNDQVGKLIIGDRNDKFIEEFVLGETNVVENSKVTTSIDFVKKSVLLYTGDILEDKNVILFADEFGPNDGVSKLIIESKPKAVINFLLSTGGNPFWLDNVD